MKKKSLGVLAIALCCVLIASPVLLSLLFFYSGVSGQMREAASNSASFYLDQVVERTELIMATLRNSIYYLTSNEQLRQLMLADGMPSELEQRLAEDDISQMLQYQSAWAQNVLGGCYIYKDGERCLTMFRSNLYAGSAQRISKAYPLLKEHNSSRKLAVLDEIPGYAYCVVDYIDIHSSRPLGKILFELEPRKLVNIGYLSSLYPGAEAMLLDGEGEVLYASVPQERTEEILAGLDGGVSGQYCAIAGEKFFYMQKQCAGYALYLDVLIPEAEILSTLHSLTRFHVTYALLALALTLLLGCVVLAILFKPLRRMVSAIDRMGTGDLSVRMEPTPYKETEQVVVAFNSMADNLGELFDEVYDKGMLLKEAEFQRLEAQISPHFIFNVLEAINMRCMVAGQPEISRMVTNLAQLLRANILQKDLQKVTFEQELQYVRYYLELQKERFSTHLHYDISYEDEELLQYYLPKLTIQPLVENSIVHGLEDKRGGGSVWVRIWEEADAVCVEVGDDGVGFDADALDLAAPQAPSKDRNRIALYNIHRRIRLLYGEKYGLRITSQTGKGTRALLTLPADHAAQ